MNRAFAAALLVFPAIPQVAIAQAPPTIVRATITSLDGDRLSVTDRAGDKKVLVLAPNATVMALRKIDMASIKPGSFIGTAATSAPDGTLRALEVHVFPESMRGAGEGHRPWNLVPASTMTNGTVGAVKGSAGRTLTIDYKGGEKIVTVPPEAPVVAFEPGDRALLVPGANIMSFATPGSGDTLTTASVTVGRDGLVPPM
ncbi:MAG: putative transrane protein [Sphingomonas bacterium]|nr:putative transrane protein [Sphingomonas bacterium]